MWIVVVPRRTWRTSTDSLLASLPVFLRCCIVLELFFALFAKHVTEILAAVFPPWMLGLSLGSDFSFFCQNKRNNQSMAEPVRLMWQSTMWGERGFVLVIFSVVLSMSAAASLSRYWPVQTAYGSPHGYVYLPFVTIRFIVILAMRSIIWPKKDTVYNMRSCWCFRTASVLVG
jgi:hypothetical protein